MGGYLRVVVDCIEVRPQGAVWAWADGVAARIVAAQRKSIPRGLRPGFGVGVCGPRLKLWGAGGLFELVIERLFEAATSVKDARNCYQALRFLNLE